MDKFRNVLMKAFYNSPYIIKKLFINLYGYDLMRKRFSGEYKYYFNFFTNTQWWESEKIKEFQIKKLKDILEIAYTKVPYYKKLFWDYGLSPRDFNSIKDLEKLPIITKEAIKKNFNSFINKDLKNVNFMERTTSGSTGAKFHFFIPKELYFNINYALIYRFYKWAGIDKFDKRVTIGARYFTDKPPYWIFNKAENQLILSIHHLKKEIIDIYIDKILEFKPIFIQGHPSGIYYLAKRILEREKYLSVKSIFTTGETLSEFQREIIENAFNTKIFEAYGSGETIIAAFECEKHTGFHEASELGIIELKKNRDNSNLYKIIGTSLWNTAMPFIRYEMGDLVEVSHNKFCSCHRKLPLKIKKITGRIDDIIFSPEGRLILPVTIRMVIKPLLGNFENYQFQQIEKKEYSVLLEGRIEEGREKLFIKVLNEILGDSAKIKVRKVEKIITKVGKVRNVVNLYK